MQQQVKVSNILVIDDDLAVRNMLRAYFTDSTIELSEALSAAEGLKMIAQSPPDLVLLDLGLPDLDGVDVIRQVRTWSNVPIIVVSGEEHEDMKVQCLDAGADDYVTKPFSIGELKARAVVALRQSAGGQDEAEVFEQGILKVDFGRRKVFVRGNEVHLTPIEFNLLKSLVTHAGKVVTSRQLLRDAWGADYDEEVQYLRVYMGYLRRKLGSNPGDLGMIATEHRVGYRLMV